MPILQQRDSLSMFLPAQQHSLQHDKEIYMMRAFCFAISYFSICWVLPSKQLEEHQFGVPEPTGNHL